MFTQKSGLVQVWADLVQAGVYKLEQVPPLMTLPQLVQQELAERENPEE